MNEESKIKILGEENFRLLEVLKMTREGAVGLDKRNRELKAMAETVLAQIKTLEQKYADRENEMARLAKRREETEKALSESESVCAAILSEKERLGNENLRLSTDLEAKAVAETRLLDKIQGSEEECAQRAIEIKAGKEAMAEQAEAHRLAIEEHELRHRMAEETARVLEKEKKTLSLELAEKAAEESQLRASLQEAHGTLEKQDARILELEAEGQAALKLAAEKTASLVVLEEIKKRLEDELEARSEEIVSLKDEIRRLEEMTEQRQREIQVLEKEKLSLSKDLKAQAAEEVRLLDEIRKLEEECAQRTIEIRAGKEAMAEQAEAHRVAIKEHETRHRMAEETARVLDQEKKALASELIEKTVEESQLRKSLQGAGETLERLNARVLELEEELQKAKKHSQALQSEKDRLEKERQAALKLDAEKTVVLAALESDKKLSESERQRLRTEKKSLEDERERLEGEKLRLEKALADLSAEANAQSEKLTKRCTELEGAISQMRDELDQRNLKIEDLTKMTEKMAATLREKETGQAALEEQLKQEKKIRVEVQAHSKSMEEILRALEKKINDMA